MTNQLDPDRKIEGSYIFTGPMSQKGYALNKLGASLMSDEARAALKNDTFYWKFHEFSYEIPNKKCHF